jgi:predicted DNA-binding transcriptional regulator AlpA
LAEANVLKWEKNAVLPSFFGPSGECNSFYALKNERTVRANYEKKKAHRMAKIAKAPSGFYSATEAIKKLGIPRSTFYQLVEKGTIKKVIQPGRSNAYYLKAAIDDLIKARELFTIQYATSSPTFHKATEADIQGIYNLTVNLWGTRGSVPYAVRLARYKKNPDIYYVLKYLDIVVGFSVIMPISIRAFEEIMTTGRAGHEIFTDEDILPFIPEKPIEHLFLEIAVRDGVPKPKQYAMYLISGTRRVIDEFARQGIIIKKLFATSNKAEGVELAHRLGFQETSLPSNSEKLAFELDLETSMSPLVRKYREIVKQVADRN